MSATRRFLQRFQRCATPSSGDRGRADMNASPATMRISAKHLPKEPAATGLAAPSVDLTSIEIDSRRCVEGSLFVALPGAHADGHVYRRRRGQGGSRASVAARRRCRPSPACCRQRSGSPDAAWCRRAPGHIAAGGRRHHRPVGKTGSKEMLAHMLQPWMPSANQLQQSSRRAADACRVAGRVRRPSGIGMNAPEISAERWRPRSR